MPTAQSQRTLDEMRLIYTERLTTLDRKIIELVADGLSNGAIAQRLERAEKTIRGRLTVIYRLLGIEFSPLYSQRVMLALAYYHIQQRIMSPVPARAPAL